MCYILLWRLAGPLTFVTYSGVVESIVGLASVEYPHYYYSRLCVILLLLLYMEVFTCKKYNEVFTIVFCSILVNMPFVPAPGNKCPACEKSVYDNEAKLAAGVKWHPMCFKCGRHQHALEPC